MVSIKLRSGHVVAAIIFVFGTVLFGSWWVLRSPPARAYTAAVSDHASDGRVLLAAVTIVLRPHPSGEFDKYQVRTQTRHVLNTKYDPFYDGTYEAVGESVKSHENVVDAVVREPSDACGCILLFGCSGILLLQLRCVSKNRRGV